MPNVALEVPGGHGIGAEDPLLIASATQVWVMVDTDTVVMGGGGQGHKATIHRVVS